MTSRQFYFIFAIFIITLKIQKMPCMLYDYLQKDSYVLFIIFIFINLIEISLAFYITKKLKEHKKNGENQNKSRGVLEKICGILLAVYFLVQATLFYESIQDLFSHILFNRLSWGLFSLFLLGLMFYIASFKYNNIGRLSEIFFPIIIVSLIILSIFGGMNSDFWGILPLNTIKDFNYLDSAYKFNFWFGDFFLVLLLAPRSENLKYSKTILTYVLSMVFVIFLVIEFNGIYFNFSNLQPSLISIISEQSLLGVDIGRIDWFLILISEVGAAIGSALCLCMAKHSISQTFKKVSPNLLLFIMIVCIYFLDVFYLTDLNTKKEFFVEIMSKYAIFIKVVFLTLLLIKVIMLNAKNKGEKDEADDSNLIFVSKRHYVLKNEINKRVHLKPNNFIKREYDKSSLNNEYSSRSISDKILSKLCKKKVDL